MIAVLISVQPRWCERVSCRDKTDELRKNAPKLPVPFKCYIYQTNAMWGYPILRSLGMNELLDRLEAGKGKVIGEFSCDKIEQIDGGNTNRISRSSCVTIDDMWEYARPKSMYDLKAWHISELKIYDKPKELNQFWKHSADGERPCEKGKHCEYEYYDYSEDCRACGIDFGGDECPHMKLSRPPQSWCYVEDQRS